MGLGGGGGSGGLVHTGSLTIFDAATAVGFSVARPQAASSPMWCGSSAISNVGAGLRWTLGPAATVA